MLVRRLTGRGYGEKMDSRSLLHLKDLYRLRVSDRAGLQGMAQRHSKQWIPGVSCENGAAGESRPTDDLGDEDVEHDAAAKLRPGGRGA